MSGKCQIRILRRVVRAVFEKRRRSTSETMLVDEVESTKMKKSVGMM